MKLVSWYDNEWGYRYSISLLLRRVQTKAGVEYYVYIAGRFTVMIHDNIYCSFLQQPSAGPD